MQACRNLTIQKSGFQCRSVPSVAAYGRYWVGTEAQSRIGNGLHEMRVLRPSGRKRNCRWFIDRSKGISFVPHLAAKSHPPTRPTIDRTTVTFFWTLRSSASLTRRDLE